MSFLCLCAAAVKQEAVQASALLDDAADDMERKGYIFSLDAKWYGNVGRFLNHSCAPNCVKQSVVTDSHDLRAPRMAVFTTRDVPAMEELTYDYGYVQGTVEGKTMVCRCGTSACRNRLY
jgi:SET domain-containing protein